MVVTVVWKPFRSACPCGRGSPIDYLVGYPVKATEDPSGIRFEQACVGVSPKCTNDLEIQYGICKQDAYLENSEKMLQNKTTICYFIVL